MTATPAPPTPPCDHGHAGHDPPRARRRPAPQRRARARPTAASPTPTSRRAGDVRRRDARLRAGATVGARRRDRHDDRRRRRPAGRHAPGHGRDPTSTERARAHRPDQRRRPRAPGRCCSTTPSSLRVERRARRRCCRPASTDAEVDATLARIAAEAARRARPVAVPRPFTFTLTGALEPAAPEPAQHGHGAAAVVVSPARRSSRSPTATELVELAPTA